MFLFHVIGPIVYIGKTNKKQQKQKQTKNNKT